MTFLRFLALILFICALLLAGLVSYVHFADLTAQRDRIAAYASNALGREVTIKGRLNIDLWPELVVEVGGLSLANAPWGSEPVMAKLGHALVRVAPLSLRQGPVVIHDVQLRDVDILQESNAEGVSNWALGDEEQNDTEDETTTTGLGVILDQAALHNLRLRQRTGAEDAVYELTSLTLSADEADRQLLQGSGRALEVPFTIKGEFDTRQQVADTGALHSALSVIAGETELALTGQRAVPTPGGEEHLKIDAQVKGLQHLLDKLKVPIKVDGHSQVQVDLQLGEQRIAGTINGMFGDVELRTQLDGDLDNLSIESHLATLDKVGAMFALDGLPKQSVEASATLSAVGETLLIKSLTLTSGDTRIEAQGEFAGEAGPSSLQLTASGELASTWGSDLPDLPFTLATDLTLSDAGLHLEPLTAALGGSDISGSVTVAGGDGAGIEARLKSSKIDVVELTGGEQTPVEPLPAGADAGATATPAGEPAPAPQPAAKKRYVFTEEPLPLVALQGNEIDATWEIAELITAVLTFNAVQLDAALHDGKLQVDTDFSGADGGKGRNRLVLDASNDNAQLTVENQLRELRVNLASGEVKSSDDIPPLSLDLALNTNGTSARAMAENSDGKVLLTIGPGLLTNSLMERFSADILAQLMSALNPFAKTETHMEFQCGVVGVKVKSGEATIDPLAVQTDKLQVIADGELDLNSEKLNIVFNTKPRKGIGVSADMFVTPFVSLEGTLMAPRVGLNEKSTIVTAGAAMATGGLSILWKGLYDRATGTVDHCKDFAGKYSHPPL